jgi:hypothetical protein
MRSMLQDLHGRSAGFDSPEDQRSGGKGRDWGPEADPLGGISGLVSLKIWELQTGALMTSFACDMTARHCALVGSQRVVAGVERTSISSQSESERITNHSLNRYSVAGAQTFSFSGMAGRVPLSPQKMIWPIHSGAPPSMPKNPQAKSLNMERRPNYEKSMV